MLTKINKLENYLLTLLLFLFPTQLAIHFWPESAFVFGIRVDYLAPAIYLTDVLAIALISLWIYLRKSEFLKTLKEHRNVFYVFFSVVILNILFSTFPELSLFRWLKYFEFLILAIYLSKKDYPIKPLYYSGVFFSLIGIFQFATGETLGGPMYLLGEREFSASTPGIALVDIAGRQFLRAYSTFAHPNAMAGYLGLVMIYLFLSKEIKKLNYKLLGFGIIGLGFITTFSISAFAAVVICFIAYKYLSVYKSKINIAKLLVAVFVTASSFQIFFGNNTYKFLETQRVFERLDLAKTAGQMIIKSPIIGAGLNTFIPNLPLYNLNGKSIWILQPVHNLFLLMFAETGLIGATIFITVIYYAFKFSLKKKNILLTVALLFVLLSGTTDHYSLTLQQNNLILVFIISHFI